MKKRYLTLPLACGLIYMLTTSELPGANLGGTVATCGQNGCHTGGPTGTTVTNSLTFTDQANNQVASGSYKPGHTYTVSLKGSSTTNLPKFGFQLKTSGGTFSNAGTGEVLQSSSMLTHGNTAISAVSNVYTVTGAWTAPGVGGGNVLFLAMFNAVNGDNNSTGDKPQTNVFSMSLSETPTAVAGVSKEGIRLYPNPASDVLHVAAGDVKSQIGVVDAIGRVQNVRSSFAGSEWQINVTALPAGNYYLLLSGSDGAKSAVFTKQ